MCFSFFYIDEDLRYFWRVWAISQWQRQNWGEQCVSHLGVQSFIADYGSMSHCKHVLRSVCSMLINGFKVDGGIDSCDWMNSNPQFFKERLVQINEKISKIHNKLSISINPMKINLSTI